MLVNCIFSVYLLVYIDKKLNLCIYKKLFLFQFRYSNILIFIGENGLCLFTCIKMLLIYHGCILKNQSTFSHSSHLFISWLVLYWNSFLISRQSRLFETILKDITESLKLIICYISSCCSTKSSKYLLRSAVGSTKLIGQLHWAFFIVI